MEECKLNFRKEKQKNTDSTMEKFMIQKEIVIFFVNYFINLFETLEHKCKTHVTTKMINEIGISHLKHYFYILKAMLEKVRIIIQKMNVNKSPGVDQLRIKYIKCATSGTASFLCKLVS